MVRGSFPSFGAMIFFHSVSPHMIAVSIPVPLVDRQIEALA
jgi:hypothetical protein